MFVLVSLSSRVRARYAVSIIRPLPLLQAWSDDPPLAGSILSIIWTTETYHYCGTPYSRITLLFLSRTRRFSESIVLLAC